MLILRDYQEKGVSEIRQSYINKKNAPLLVMPTGSGKTIVFSYIAINTAARKKRVLILVHRIELMRQTSAKLYESGVEHGLINVKFTPNNLAGVQVASVQTLVRRLDKARFDYDLIIIDEAHHAVASTWKRIIDKVKSVNPNVRLLGVTATPVRSDGTGLRDMFDTLILGPSVKRLTAEGRLVNCEVYAPSEKLDFSNVGINKDGDYNENDLQKIVDNSQITGDAVDQYRKVCKGKPAIVFCVSVSHAENVASQFREAGFRSQAVYGDMDDNKRRSLISGLSNGQIEVLTSCDLVSEGTDIPCVVCGISLRPTQSLGLYLQQVGRILRPYPGKNAAYWLDHVGNVLTHGMPDEEHAWTLEGEVKKKKKKSDSDEPKILVKQCPVCFCVHTPATVCPKCGHVYFVEDKTPDSVDGELKRMDADDIARVKRMKNKEVATATTMEELTAIAVKRGYKPAWAKHIFEARTKKITASSPY